MATRSGHSGFRALRRVLTGAVTTTIVVFSLSASALEVYPPAVENQCRDDYFKYCSPYALGSTELRRCMETQGKQLSPNCRQALKDAGLVRTTSERR